MSHGVIERLEDMIYNDDVVEKCDEAANDTLNSIVHVQLENKLNWSEHKHKQIIFFLTFGFTSILKNLTEKQDGVKVYSKNCFSSFSKMFKKIELYLDICLLPSNHRSPDQDVLLAKHHLLAVVVLVVDLLRVAVVLDVGHIHRFTCVVCR